jgi:hypothetical protein
LFLTIVSAAQAKYSGGTGEPDDPYQIATAEDLMLLGESPEDYDKHFILTADIDLDPNLPGRKVFEKAVIASGGHALRYRSFIGIPFTGVFDGNSHTVSHLTIIGEWNLGLFGYLNSGAEVKNLGVVDANINGLGSFVGSLAGNNFGNITACYSTGTASGTGAHVGGLVGKNSNIISYCYSTVAVSGDSSVGGLVGENYGTVTQCYSTGTASGRVFVGGLVGLGSPSGGTHSVWDTQTSGLGGSEGGVGLTTAEMMDPYMLGLNGFAEDPNWVLDAGRDYPRLAWEGTPGTILPEPQVDWLEGMGTPQDPYRIVRAEQLISLRRASAVCDRYFVLGADIDLDPALPGGEVFTQALIPAFSGTLDGRNQKISHLTIIGAEYLGLFGQLDSSAEVSNLILEAVDVNGTGSYVGSLSGYNQGNIITSYSSGSIVGDSKLGGLVGCNSGNITSSYSNVLVTGVRTVGGLTGDNYGIVIDCYSIGTVSGTGSEVGGLGGLVGSNLGSIIQCYSTGGITGKGELVGGLVAFNSGSVNQCYRTSSVSGN